MHLKNISQNALSVLAEYDAATGFLHLIQIGMKKKLFVKTKMVL